MAEGEPESLRMLCGDADFGTAMLERYAVVPGFFNPRVLLPLDGSEAALGAALAQHASGAASPVARAAARGLHLANRLGLAQSFLRRRTTVGTGAPARIEPGLHGFLADVLGHTNFLSGKGTRLNPRT